jgi:hypothetical protein
MTTLTVEVLQRPASARDARVLAWERAWADDQLAGRTVWQTGVSPAWSGEEEEAPHTTRLDVSADEPLRILPDWLTADPAPGPVADELCEAAAAAADAVVGAVHAGDVVVLHDVLSALLAQAVRERDAHAVWVSETWPVPIADRDLLRRHAAALDAYVTVWPSRHALVAFMPSPDAVTARAGWSQLLGEVVDADRAEHVGGRRHVRPFVALR